MRTGSSATTTSEQSVINDFAASNSVIIGTFDILESYLMDKQNFQHAGFPFYDAMPFVIPSTAQGHSSFRGTRANDVTTVGSLDDNEDTPGMFSSS